MALASHRITIVKRSSGRSSVAASAYRSGEELHNEREGITYCYPQKSDIVYTEILTPSYAPEWARSRSQLWNAVEQAEKGKNAQTAREIRIALPKELSQEQNTALARAWAQTFVNDGMCADLAIHDKGDGNPHAHLLLTMRPLREDGTWAPKCRKEYILDEQGEKIRLKSGEYKSRKVDTTDWNHYTKAKEWMQRYEKITNYYLAKAGHPERISVKSYKEQGLDQEPTIHLGHYAHSLEQAGIATVKGDINRQIQRENRDRQTLQAIDQELSELQEARHAALATSKPSPQKSFEEQLAEKTREREEERRRRREREEHLH